VLRQHGVDEALLPLKRLNRTAARLVVIVQRGVDNLREQLAAVRRRVLDLRLTAFSGSPRINCPLDSLLPMSIA
jgi:hypothetical protein